MSLFGTGSLFGGGGTAPGQLQQKPQQQQTGGLFGGTAAGGGGGGGSLLFGQPTATASGLGSRPAGSSLFPTSSSSSGLFQGSLLLGGGGGTAAGGAAAAGTSAPFSSLFAGTNAATSLSSAPLATAAGLTGATPAAAAGLSGQATATPASAAGGGGLLGSLSAATAGGGLLGTLPTTAAAGLPTAVAAATLPAAAGGGGVAAGSGAVGGAVPGVVGLLPLHQQQYLATVDARVQRIESMLADETESMATFMYQYEMQESPSTGAATAGTAAAAGGAVRLTPQQHNEAMEAQLQQLLLLRPGDEGLRLLLRKWRKAKDENPDPTRCRIVLMQGTKQLAERVAAAAQLTQLLLKTLETVGNNTDQLLSRNQQLLQKLDLVRERHRFLGHEFIRVLHLIEHVALERGVCERNVRCEKANAQILAALLAAFPWEEWQRRLDLLRVWTAALDRSAAAVCLREGAAAPAPAAAKGRGAFAADEGGKAWLAHLQEAAEEDELKDVARVLAAQGEALEELNLSLAYTEQQTELLEDATLRRLKQKQEEVRSAANAGDGAVAAGGAKKGLL